MHWAPGIPRALSGETICTTSGAYAPREREAVSEAMSGEKIVWRKNLSRHRPRMRAIQYSRDVMMEPRGRSVLDTRMRGYDKVGRPIRRTARHLGLIRTSGPALVSPERDVDLNRLPTPAWSCALLFFEYRRSIVKDWFGSGRNRVAAHASRPVQSRERTDVAVCKAVVLARRLRRPASVRFRRSPAGISAGGSPRDPAGRGHARRARISAGERGRHEQDDGGHDGQADRRCRPRLRRHDDAASSGRHRHGA